MQGLCAYILQQDAEAASKGVVIGHVGALPFVLLQYYTFSKAHDDDIYKSLHLSTLDTHLHKHA